MLRYARMDSNDEILQELKHRQPMSELMSRVNVDAFTISVLVQSGCLSEYLVARLELSLWKLRLSRATAQAERKEWKNH